MILKSIFGLLESFSMKCVTENCHFWETTWNNWRKISKIIILFCEITYM